MISQEEHDLILQKCKGIPPAKGMYLVKDYIENLLLTVLDFQMHNVSVEKAITHYRKYRYDEVRTLSDLKELLSKYNNDKEGNTVVAQYLWGNRHWTRVGLLRNLVTFFESIDITSQEVLSDWAKMSDFKRCFQGKIPGMGYAIYQWLIMRQGIETIKPDLHVRRFVESILHRSDITDEQLVATLEDIARELGLKAYELDWRIWEYQRAKV